MCLIGCLLLAFGALAFGRPLFTHAPGRGAEVVKLGTLELTTSVAFDALVFVLVLGVVVGIIHAVGRAFEEAERP